MYETVTTHARLTHWLDSIASSPAFAIDTETTSTNPHTAELVGVSLAIKRGPGYGACYIPLAHTTGEPQLSIDDVLLGLAPICANPEIVKVLHNAVYDMLVLGRLGIEFQNVDDTMLMSYAMRPGTGHGMDQIAREHLDYRTIEFDEVMLPAIGMETFADVRHSHATEYAAEDTAVTLRFYHHFKRELWKAGLWKVYTEIDRPIIPAVYAMAYNGVGIDRKALARLDREWNGKLDAILQRLHEIAPGLDPASSKSVGEFLEAQGLQSPKKSKKTGASSWDAEVLELLSDEHPAVGVILEYRKWSKLLNTYITEMPNRINPYTRRLHASMNPCVTVTARFSSSGPNLQNIPSPAKGEAGTELRGVFSAAPGHVLVAGDYSQIEMRILAHVTKDPVLLKAYHDGLDLHTQTASIVFGHEYDHMVWVLEEVDGKPVRADHKDFKNFKFFRRAAKTINFGLVYGMTYIGLAKSLKVHPDTAQGFIDRYFENLTGVNEWAERQKAFGVENRYVESIYGRRLFLEQGAGKYHMSAAERQAMNYVIQGSAADLMRLAIGDVHYWLNEYGYGEPMLLTVHDELVFEVKEEVADDVIDIVRRAMQQAGGDWIKWRVPIIADVKKGKTWKDAH